MRYRITVEIETESDASEILIRADEWATRMAGDFCDNLVDDAQTTAAVERV